MTATRAVPVMPAVLILGGARLHRDRYLMGANVRPAAFRSSRGPSLAASVAASATAALALAGGAVACGGAPAASGVVSVSNGGCGGGWHLAGPGWHTFQVYNASAEGAEVDLVNPANGAIYAEVEALGPGTTSPMRLNVGSGSYAFRCLFEDFSAITGPAVTVGGHATGTPAIRPITRNDLLAPARTYHDWIAAGLGTLAGQGATLASDIRGGNLGRAKADWLTAHLTYERLGAAYDAFGDFDGKINGTAAGLDGGVNSPDWTGFYRLEYGLWHGQSARQLAGVANTLVTDVRGLRAAWPTMEIDLLDMGLRTHEILENALQFQLTGQDDYGSGTTLATVGANIAGTRELLTVLHPLLAPRYAGLPAVSAWLDRLASLLDQAKKPNGAWIPVSALSSSLREQIDAAASQSLEELAPIAAITEPRRT
jgi:iron uptake system component EfeO